MDLQITLTSYSTYQKRLITLPWTLLHSGQTSHSLMKKMQETVGCHQCNKGGWRNTTLRYVAYPQQLGVDVNQCPLSQTKNISLCYKRTIRCYLTWGLQVDRSSTAKKRWAENWALTYAMYYIKWLNHVRWSSFFVFQTWTLVLMSTAHLSGSARHTVLMKHAACVLTTAPPIRTQYALQTEQLTTTNAGTSWATAGDWTITLFTTLGAVKVGKRDPLTQSSK